MRRAFVLFAILILLPAPLGQAQTEPEGPLPSVRVVDPANDQRQIGPNGNQSDNGEHPQADILEVWIGNETLETVEFGIRFKQVQNPDDAANLVPLGLVGLAPIPGFSIHWKLGLANFTIESGGEMTNCGGTGTGFRRETERSSSISCGAFDPELDPEGQALRFVIPRERLLNDTDAPFGPGDDITGLYATASVPITPGPAGTTARDRAPDEGVGPDYHSTLAGEQGSGAFTMSAVQPVRVSNGESTTLVYPVELTNLEDTDRIVVLSVKSDMPDWQIRVPARLQLASKETLTFPVILSMGFSHDHGGLTTFDIRAEDASDASHWAKVRLGVFWLDTPQPAGHHDKLWLHSGTGSSGYSVGLASRCSTIRAWFNPLEEELEGRAPERDVAGCDFSVGDPTNPPTEGQTFEWRLPLDPPLAIGLDFDLERIGTFTAAIRTKLGSPSATFRMELLICDPNKEPGDRRIVFERCSGAWLTLADASTSRALTPNAVTPIALEFTPTPEADFLPFQRNSNLLLYLTLRSDQPLTPPGQSAPEYGPLLVVDGSEITLPLIEYHDPIDQAFENVGTLELSAKSAFEKPINPGRRSLFEFELANRGDVAQDVELQIEGHNREWARVLGSSTLHLSPGISSNVTVVSEAPFDAAPGERAELFIVAQSQTDPNVVAIARLRSTLVDPLIQDVPDEDPSKVAIAADAAPSIGAGVVVAALALALTLGRRTRR